MSKQYLVSNIKFNFICHAIMLFINLMVSTRLINVIDNSVINSNPMIQYMLLLVLSVLFAFSIIFNILFMIKYLEVYDKINSGKTYYFTSGVKIVESLTVIITFTSIVTFIYSVFFRGYINV